MTTLEESLEPWRNLYQKLIVRGDGGTCPTAEELDRFEAMAGVRLAAGYRGFIQTFGPGSFNKSLSSEVSICSPSCPNQRFHLNPGADVFQNLRTGYGLTDQARRLIYFASDYSGGSFGWDPEEPTDPTAPEFAIYALYRGRKQADKMSTTFAGFIKICLDGAALREHQRKGIYHEDAAETDFSLLDGLRKRKVYSRVPSGTS